MTVQQTNFIIKYNCKQCKATADSIFKVYSIQLLSESVRKTPPKAVDIDDQFFK